MSDYGIWSNLALPQVSIPVRHFITSDYLPLLWSHDTLPLFFDSIYLGHCSLFILYSLPVVLCFINRSYHHCCHREASLSRQKSLIHFQTTSDLRPLTSELATRKSIVAAKTRNLHNVCEECEWKQWQEASVGCHQSDW